MDLKMSTGEGGEPSTASLSNSEGTNHGYDHMILRGDVQVRDTLNI